MNELLISRQENQIFSVFSEEKRIVQIHASEHLDTGGEVDSSTCRVGDIYIGKVRNIVKNINAAFVEFSKGQMGYLSLSSPILPLHTQGFPYQEGRVLIGDEIIVQIAKEAVKTKPPTLSGGIDLTGRYVVLSIGKEGYSISKKIKNKEMRESLSEILSDYSRQGFGLIARTNSASVAEEVLRRELELLLKRYEKITVYGMHKQYFTCLEKAPETFLCDIRDGYQQKIEQILTDDDVLYDKIKEYMENTCPEEKTKLKKWNPEHGKMDAVYNISHTISHALMPKVWLKSGAYLIIQPTEALVSIDVNSGKAISKKKDVQKTFLKINLEAAEEIARQLRLRNLSGMILVDFIDMELPENNEKLLEVFRSAVREDQIPTTVVDITKLGLVEVTRKKVRKSLYEQIHKITDSK